MRLPLSFLVLLLTVPVVAQGAAPLPLRTEYWKSESFLASFNGSYLPSARIEPTLSSDERGVLVSLQGSLASGDREAAIAKLKDNSLTSGSAALTFNLGNLYFETGKLEDAAKAFEKAIAAFPSFRRAHRNLAFALVRLDRPEPALEHLTRAIELGEQDANALGLLGYLRLLRDEAASALVAYQQAILLDGERTEWPLGAVQALLQLDRAEEALPWIQQLIDQQPERYDLDLVQADVLLALGREAEAAAALALVHRLGRLPVDRQLLFGQLLLRQGAHQFAATQLRPSFEALQAGNETRAIDTVRTALRLNEVDLAEELLGKLDEKLPVEAQAQDHDQAPERTLLRAEIDLALENREPALAALEKLVREHPLMGRPLILLAEETAATDPDHALLLLDRATRIEDSAFEAYYAKSHIQVTRERYQDAIKSLKAALEIRHDDNLADYLEALENLSK